MIVSRFVGGLTMPRLNGSKLLDGRMFVLVVILGGLFILQGSNDLDGPKVVYFVLATAAVIGAVASAPWWLSRMGTATASPWLVASASIAALLIVSLAVSRAHGTSLTSWLRDASTYALFAAAPVLALACARSASRQWLTVVIAVCGAVASLSFAVEWIGRRQLAHLPIDRIGLPTETLAAALLALATAVALAGSPRKWWGVAIGGTVLGLFFVTGSRSTLLLLVVPFGAAIFARLPWRASTIVILAELAMALAVFFVGESAIAIANGKLTIPQLSSTTDGGQTGNPTATPAPDRLGERVSSVGTLVVDPGSDPSIQERLAQTRAAWDAFASSPLLGVGPGHTFTWANISNKVVDEYTLDTPLVYLAKFGLLGLVPLALFAAAYLRLVLELWRRHQAAQIEFLALVGFALVLAVVTLQFFPIEDKGTSFALILLVALGLHGLLGQDSSGELADASTSAG